MINKKKILIVGSNEFFTLDSMYFSAFKKLNHKVNFFHIISAKKKFLEIFLEKYFSFFYYFYLRMKLLNFLDKKNYNYDLIVFFKGLYLRKELLIKIKKKKINIKIINIFPDDPLNIHDKNISNSKVLESFKYFDLICIWSKNIIKKLKKKKIKKIIYLPFAYDKSLHFRSRRSKKKKNLINFIGSYDLQRKKILDSIDYNNILILGNGWNRIYNNKKAIFKNNLCEIISSSMISLNILREQNKDSHNMRTFEIPAMGGLMLTNRSKEQKFFFKENHDCLMFSNIKELNKKINFIINNKDQINLIKNNAFKKVKKHTYLNRSKYLLSNIFNK